MGFNFGDFKKSQKDMVQDKDFSMSDQSGGDDTFINHEMEAIFSLKAVRSGISDKPGSFYEKHPFHAFTLEPVQIKFQADHLPYHTKDAEAGDFTPTPAPKITEGQSVCQWYPLPRSSASLTLKEKYMLRDVLRMWAAVFQVKSALVDLDDAQEITEEDGKPIEGRLIGVKFSAREWEDEDKGKYGTRLTPYPYPVDQDTLERVQLRGAHEVAGYLVEAHNSGAVEIEKVAETLDYLIEIEEISEEDGAEYMKALDD